MAQESSPVSGVSGRKILVGLVPHQVIIIFKRLIEMIIDYFLESVKTPVAKGFDDNEFLKSFAIYKHCFIKLRNARALGRCQFDSSHDCYTHDQGGCQYCNSPSYL